MTPDQDPFDATVPIPPAVRAFWEAACAELGMPVSDDLLVNCERFERVWPA